MMVLLVISLRNLCSINKRHCLVQSLSFILLSYHLFITNLVQKSMGLHRDDQINNLNNTVSIQEQLL